MTGRGLSRAAGAAALLAVAAAWLWASGGVPMAGAGGAMHDDALFVRLAGSLERGEWLGPYGELTLAKGPAYPMLLAATLRCGAPLAYVHAGLLAGAAALLALALAPLLRPRWLATLLFVAVFLTPVVSQRVVREAVYPALTLLVLAGASGVFARRHAPARALAPWSALLSLALPPFWLTREEGIWLAPALAVLLGAAVAAAGRRSGRRAAARVAGAALAVPAVILAAGVLSVAAVNRARYGVSTVLEIDSRPFVSAYGALSRIRVAARVPRVPVPREARERAYAVSPAFGELRPLLEGQLGASWQAPGCALHPETCGDIAGGWFQWALREAAARTGHHRSAPQAAAYYRRVASEVNDACASGRLDCLPERHTLAPVDTASAVPGAVRDLVPALAYLLRLLPGASPAGRPMQSSGDTASLAPFGRLSRRQLAVHEAEPRSLTVRGWAFRKGGAPLRLRVVGLDGAPRPSGTRSERDPGLAAYLGSPAGATARFTLVASCDGPCLLAFTDGDVVLGRLPLRDPGSGELGEVRWALDQIDVERSREPASWKWRRALLVGVARVYTPGLPVAAVASAAFTLALCVAGMLRRRVPALLVPLSALGVAVAARVALLLVVDRTSFAAVHPGYFTCGYPLVSAFAFLAAAGLVHVLRLGRRAARRRAWKARGREERSPGGDVSGRVPPG